MINKVLAFRRVVGAYPAPGLPRVGLRPRPRTGLGRAQLARSAVALAVHADANQEHDTHVQKQVELARPLSALSP